MDLMAHLAGCYDRIEHDRRRAIREENLKPIQYIINRLRIGLRGDIFEAQDIWDDTFTRWMTLVQSDPCQSVRIYKLCCALAEQSYLTSLRIPPLSSKTASKKVKNRKIMNMQQLGNACPGGQLVQTPLV